MSERVLVTGGCGYVGTHVVDELLQSGRQVRVLDVLLHGQESVAEAQRTAGVEVIRADIRDASARGGALEGVDAVVHLAAIVGDPACARNPSLADDVNVRATDDLLSDARARDVGRFVFASTCSNYGRMEDPTVPITEEGVLAPVSLYAEQKVAMERAILAANGNGFVTTCLRFATVYGVSARMRFDLTVNEFTRDLWADRELHVFGETFWRPYIHARDAARAVRTALETTTDLVAGEVYNTGRSGENYRKVDLVEEIGRQIATGRTVYVHRDEDPRDYKVSFDKIRARLGFETAMTVPDGIAELVAALDARAFDDPFDARYRNTP
jgi:nucleoside-diphosphate-sugar epimerase